MLGNSNARILVFLLRLGAVLTGSAIFTVFLSEETMASVHAALGLGTFPSAPITSYLARSLSAMYAFHGALLFVLSTDVRRFQPVITFVGWGTAALGVVLLVIDLQAPMPSWWILGEGPWVVVIGLVLVRLSSRLDPG